MSNIPESAVYSVVGTDGLVLQPDRRGWDEARGVYTERRYEGPAPLIRARFNELVAQGAASGAVEIQEDYDGHAGTLTLRIPDSTLATPGDQAKAISDNWECRIVEVMKPLESHPDYIGLGADEMSALVLAAREGVPFDGEDIADELYRWLCAGVTQYREFNIHLRRVRTVTKTSTLRASFSGINEVVALSTIGVPSGILSALPSNWEYLYLGASVTLSGRLYTISEEWIGASKWASFYTGGTLKPSA